jgi:hypothetical protein
MSVILWKLPVPSSALSSGGARLEIREKRSAAIKLEYEDEDGILKEDTLVFQGIEAFKCTYYRARGVSALQAYDHLIDRGSTNWLAEISGNLQQNGSRAEGLHHLMIDFDDGPCFEFLCRGFQIESR